MNIEDDTTQTVKPDIVINLADGNHIICDSKVSLDNWKKFVMATEDQEKDEQFKKHALAVRKHIDDLSKKDYMKNLKIILQTQILIFTLEVQFQTMKLVLMYRIIDNRLFKVLV